MDSASIDTLRQRVQLFRSVVQNHRHHFSETGKPGEYPAFAPYCLRELVLNGFNSLAAEGVDLPHSLWREYVQTCDLFTEFEAAKGSAYRAVLLRELGDLVQEYQASLCFGFIGSPTGSHGDLPGERKIIGILLRELKKDHNLTELERYIALLDASVVGVETMTGEPMAAPSPGIPDSVSTICVPCDKGIP